MTGLIGKKIGMTRMFSHDGESQAVTVLQAGPCVVTQIKTEEKDGYAAIQVGFGEKNEKQTKNTKSSNKPMKKKSL